MQQNYLNPSRSLEKFEILKGGDEGKPSWNFSAGPCILPRPVLDAAARDIINYKGSG